MSSEQTKNNTYMLDIAELGAQRLEILNEVLNQSTRSFIHRNADLNGKNVLEIACGIGDLACEISKEVGAEGHLHGVDYSEKFIQQAQSKAQEKKIKNLTFQVLDISDLNQLDSQYDVIYLRAILCHLKNVEKILAEISKLLKKNGILICEESAVKDSFICYPENATFNQWVYKFRAEMAKFHGTDFDIGYKLPHLGSKLGLRVEAATMYQPFLINSRQKKLITILVAEVLPKLIEKGVYSPLEAENFLKDLDILENDSEVIPSFLRIAQIAFKKV